MSMLHKLENPIDYHTDHMDTCIVGAERKPGFQVLILKTPRFVTSAELYLLAIDPADEWNLKQYMEDDKATIVGTGVLVEKVWVDEWFVAWRSFSPAIKPIEWNDK